MNDNSGRGGFIPLMPGQRESRKSNKDTERDLPLSQTGANIVLWAFAFLLLWANALIIGPGLGVTAVLVVVVYTTVLVHVWSVGSRAEGWAPIIGFSLCALWVWFGPRYVEHVWFDARSTWRPIYKATFAAFSLPVVGIAGMNIWRFLYEVVDPNSPGPVGIRPSEWGILWPWSVIPSEEPEVVVETVVEEVDVIRPVPKDERNKTTVTPEKPPDPARVKRNCDKMMRTPFGRKVKVSDLVTFIRLAPKTSPAFSTWNKRRRSDGSEWDLAAWQDVVDIWAMYGVVTKRENGKKTRVLVSDFTEAMGLLSSAFD